MRVLHTTPLEVARRFIGAKEVEGPEHNPLILAMLQQDNEWPATDEVPWCSALPAFVCRILGLGRSRSLRARSWLLVGEKVDLDDAEPGFDLVVLARGSGPQPGPSVLDAPGHVGFFVGWIEDGDPLILGGNQDDSVNIRAYPHHRILGIRRLR